MSSKSFNRFFNRFLLSIAAISIGNVAVLSLVPDRDSDRVSAQIPTKAQAQLKLPVSPKPRSGLRLTNPTTPNPAARSTGSEFIPIGQIVNRTDRLLRLKAKLFSTPLILPCSPICSASTARSSPAIRWTASNSTTSVTRAKM